MNKDFLYETLLSNHLISSVLLPIKGNRDEILIVYDNQSFHCLSMTINNKKIVYLKRGNIYKQQDYDAVLAYSEDYVYLIPTDDIYDFSTLMLNDKKNHYLLNSKNLQAFVNKHLEERE